MRLCFLLNILTCAVILAQENDRYQESSNMLHWITETTRGGLIAKAKSHAYAKDLKRFHLKQSKDRANLVRQEIDRVQNRKSDFDKQLQLASRNSQDLSQEISNIKTKIKVNADESRDETQKRTEAISQVEDLNILLSDLEKRVKEVKEKINTSNNIIAESEKRMKDLKSYTEQLHQRELSLDQKKRISDSWKVYAKGNSDRLAIQIQEMRKVFNAEILNQRELENDIRHLKESIENIQKKEFELRRKT